MCVLKVRIFVLSISFIPLINCVIRQWKLLARNASNLKCFPPHHFGIFGIYYILHY